MTFGDFELEHGTVQCPVCESENTKITQKIMDIPHFSQIWLFNLTCPDCRYKHNDFLILDIKEPTRLIYHAENKEDYTTKIVRAANGTISIPQIGAMIEPGPSADGFINNIEGIIRDIQDKAIFLKKNAETEEEIEKINEYIELLNSYIDRNLPIDIVIEDPFGNSTIIPFDPAKLETFKLSPEEAGKLKTGYIIFENVKK